MRWIAAFLLSIAGLAAALLAATQDIVTMAPNGAYVMGLPKAKVRVIEYISYTCPHCAHFIEESDEPLKNGYVARGEVSVEIRSFARDQFDMTAALLARCGGATKFFGNTKAIMARQAVWMADAQLLVTKQGARMTKLPIGDQLKLIARNTELGSIMQGRGLTTAQQDACLLNKTAQNQIVLMTREGQARKIPYTPYFLVNGRNMTSTGSWEVLEAALKKTLGK
jgi:protein-disulfide isomerase